MSARKDMPLSKTKIRFVTFALLFAFAVGYTAYDIMIAYPNAPHGGEGKPVAFTVERGISSARLVRELSSGDLISSPGKLGLWLRLTGAFARVRAGEFMLHDAMTPREVMAAISGRGIDKGVRVTIPEGVTLSQMAEILARANLVKKSDFRKVCFQTDFLKRIGIPAPSAEGFLFPDTYYFDGDVTAEAVVQRMHENFKLKTKALELPSGKTLRELITLASIVQAEAKVADEAPVIAGVYWNRLNTEKFPSGRLQADPTVSYGCDPFLRSRPPSCDTFKGKLGSKQLQDAENRYNTYRHAGLPPGPICAPGLAAIKAAKNPAAVPYLYFVVAKDGRHTFSETLAEHDIAVKAYRASIGQ